MTTPFTAYEVGKYYKIPCVRVGSMVPACARKGGWIPVLLPWHEDKAFLRFPHHHYHYDPRFLGTRRYQGFGFAKVITRHPAGLYDSDSPLTFFIGPIVYRRLKCQRPMPQFPVFDRYWGRRHWPSKLEAAYAHDHLRNGVCPHKGIDLTTCPVVDGVVTCPGHGLRWNVETGKLVRRWPEANKKAA